MSNFKLKKGNGLLNDSFILIKYNNEIKLNNYSGELLKRFMNYVNGMIGAKTSANYHIEKVINYTIKIPIYVYTNNEKNSDPVKLVIDKINNVRNFLENFDWKMVGKTQLWLVRSLHILGINISNAFTLSTETPNLGFNDIINDPIIMNFPKLEYPKIEREKFTDASFITYLSDPYLVDYGMFVNLTVPFDEMGMSYNGLHLYEHLMTKAWDKLNGINLIEMNGSTWPQAICYVYTIHNTIESMKEYAANSIVWHLKSREKGFWKKHKDQLNLEIERTVSETRKERTLASMGRSDLHAYNYSYNTEIFEYWSNKPFELLIVGPTEMKSLKLNSETINGYIRKYMPRKDIKRPDNIKFKYFPVDVLKMKKMQGFQITKIDSNDIKNKMLESDFDGESVYGLDCSFSCKYEDLSIFNSVLHPLLFNNKLMSDEELNKFLQNHVLPFSSLMFGEAPIQIKNASLYLKGKEDENDDEN